VTRARTAADGAAPSADAGHFSLADPRGLDKTVTAGRLKQGQGSRAKLPSDRVPPVRRSGNATTPLPMDEAVQYIGSRWLGKTTGHILEALVGRHR
jgi:hypothetical protein